MRKIISFFLVCTLVFFSGSCINNTQSTDIVSNVIKNLRKDYGNGKDVRIAIIDSGIDVNMLSDEYALNFSDENTTVDSIDHGTPIWNIIANEDYGISPEATVYSLKVINEYGNANIEDIVNALQWCLDNSIDIINMSLSFGIESENIECLIDELIKKGVIIVASINNDSKEIDNPSMYPGVISVGKTNFVNIYDKTNSVIFANECKVKTVGTNGKHKEYLGNSFLAPIVTGMIACLIEKTNHERRYSNEELVVEVRRILFESNIKINLTN